MDEKASELLKKMLNLPGDDYVMTGIYFLLSRHDADSITHQVAVSAMNHVIPMIRGLACLPLGDPFRPSTEEERGFDASLGSRGCTSEKDRKTLFLIELVVRICCRRKPVGDDISILQGLFLRYIENPQKILRETMVDHGMEGFEDLERERMQVADLIDNVLGLELLPTIEPETT